MSGILLKITCGQRGGSSYLLPLEEGHGGAQFDPVCLYMLENVPRQKAEKVAGQCPSTTDTADLVCPRPPVPKQILLASHHKISSLLI